MKHGTVSCYVYHKCRCDDCRAAKASYERERGQNRRNGARAEHKRRWDRENRPLCECGQPMRRGSSQCIECKRAADAWLRRQVEEMWAEGMTGRQIADALGWKSKNPAQHICALRRDGYNLPHRRTPEQIARMTGGDGDDRLKRARAVAWAQRIARERVAA